MAICKPDCDWFDYGWDFLYCECYKGETIHMEDCAINHYWSQKMVNPIDHVLTMARATTNLLYIFVESSINLKRVGAQLKLDDSQRVFLGINVVSYNYN